MFDLTSLGKWLLVIGLGIAALGAILWGGGRLGLPLGRLPGNFRFETGGVTCLVPLTTSILLSLGLTVLLNLILRGGK